MTVKKLACSFAIFPYAAPLRVSALCSQEAPLPPGEGTRVSCRRPGAADEIRARSTGSPRTRVRYALEARTRGSRRDATRGRSRGSNCATGARRAARKPSTRAFSPNVPNGRLFGDDDRAGWLEKNFRGGKQTRVPTSFDAIRRARSRRSDVSSSLERASTHHHITLSTPSLPIPLISRRPVAPCPSFAWRSPSGRRRTRKKPP